MKRTRKVKAPGRAIELTVPLGPPATEAAEPIPDCEPAITGLFWFSDSTGLYDQDVEAAYLLTEGGAGPVLGVAGLVGEDCRLPVTWTVDWTPASGSGGDPGYFEDGARLVVYPLADTVPGVLEVSAEHDGQSYGPILLTVLRYSCYCYGAIDRALQWYDAHAVFAGGEPEGIVWKSSGKPCTPESNSGQCNVPLTIRAGYELPPSTMRIRISYIPTVTPEGPWEFRFYLNSVDESFYVNGSAATGVIKTIPANYSALSIYFPGMWVNGTLALEIECYGP